MILPSFAYIQRSHEIASHVTISSKSVKFSNVRIFGISLLEITIHGSKHTKMNHNETKSELLALQANDEKTSDIDGKISQ